MDMTAEDFKTRQDQFKPQLRSLLTDGGVFAGGTVVDKTSSPAKDGRDAAYKLKLAVWGATIPVKLPSKAIWDSIGVGSFYVFRVKQTTFEGNIYNTALE